MDEVCFLLQVCSAARGQAALDLTPVPGASPPKGPARSGVALGAGKPPTAWSGPLGAPTAGTAQAPGADPASPPPPSSRPRTASPRSPRPGRCPCLEGSPAPGPASPAGGDGCRAAGEPRAGPDGSAAPAPQHTEPWLTSDRSQERERAVQTIFLLLKSVMDHVKLTVRGGSAHGTPLPGSRPRCPHPAPTGRPGRGRVGLRPAPPGPGGSASRGSPSGSLCPRLPSSLPLSPKAEGKNVVG